jgi:putative transposase
LDPTVAQANALARAAGCARFAYNWGLAEWRRQYEAGGTPNIYALSRQFNAIKREQFPWVLESPKDASGRALLDLGVAFRNYFSSLKGTRKGERKGHPKPRRKGQDDAFYVSNDKFRFSPDGKWVRLPVIGKVRIHQPLRLTGRILNGRVRRRAGRWFLAVLVDCGDVRRPGAAVRRLIVGVDLGLKTAVVPSQGLPLNAPKPLRAALRRLRRADRRLSRRRKGGANREKARLDVARIHFHVANIRRDFWHKVTTQLCRENQAVVIEDLHVRGMVRHQRLARTATDAGLGMFRPMMQYKGPIYGCEIIVADRWFASSKRCAKCSAVKKTLSLSERIYSCEACGVVEDRDRNAALNLEQYPRLAGNWARKSRTPMDDHASTCGLHGSSMLVDEVGTNQCRYVGTP